MKQRITTVIALVLLALTVVAGSANAAAPQTQEAAQEIIVVGPFSLDDEIIVIGPFPLDAEPAEQRRVRQIIDAAKAWLATN